MKNCYYRKGIRIAVIGDNILVRKCCLHNVPNTMNGLIEAAKVKYISNIEKYIISVDDFLKSTDVRKLLVDMLNGMVDEPTNSCYKYKTACPNLTNNKESVDCIDVDLFGCNIKCEMCVMPRYYSQRDIDNYFKVLDKLKNDSDFSHITPTTVGEPFFHKEKMINFLRSQSDKNNPRMAFLTNATLLTEDYVDEIDVQKVSYMLISFHGISKGVYESIMAGADFDKTLHNVLYLREKNFPITINYIIQEKNLCEPIQDVIDFWKEKDILFRFSVDYRDYPPEKENIKNEVLKKFESVPEIYKDTYILANITNGICYSNIDFKLFVHILSILL